MVTGTSTTSTGSPSDLQTKYPAPTGDGIDSTAPAADDSRASIYYAEVCSELNDATTALDVVMSDLVDGTASPLLGEVSNTNSLCDELVGAADLMLSDAQTQLNKVTDTVVKSGAKDIGTAIDSLGAVGFTLPYFTSDMVHATEGDFLQLVANASPTLSSAMGIPQTPYQSMQGFTSEPIYGTVGSGTAYGSNQPSDVLLVPPTYVPPVVPPVPPVNATGTTQGVTQSGTSPQCCPAPVNVTVVVPPIAVTAPAPVVNVENEVESAPAQVFLQNRPTFDGTGKTVPATGSTPGGVIYKAPPILPPLDVNATATATAVAPPPPPPPAPGMVASPLLFSASTTLPTIAGPDGISWNDPAACAKVTKVVTTALNPPPAPVTSGPSTALDDFIANSLPWVGESSRWFTKKGEEVWGKAPYDWARKQFDSVMGTGKEFVNKTVDAVTAKIAADLISPTSTANPTAAIYYAGRIGMANKVESTTGLPLSYLYQSDTYLYQYSNPQYLPNQIRVDGAFLAGQISEDVWLCWTRANGNLPEPARRIMLADQAKPGLMELLSLYRRGNLKKEDLPKRARELGVLDPNYVNEWLAITKQLPTQSDLIRFMVRDAADDQVAKEYGYDKDFDRKYTGALKSWAEALGLDETYFRYSWRVHWTVPSDTRLEEMFHRLRPDRPQVAEWDAFAKEHGEQAAEQSFGPRPPIVTLDDVREALEVNDVAPRWIDPQIAIGYTPINRTDAVRAYQIGAFDERRLYHAFRDVGYSPEDAETLVKYHAQDKARKRSNVTGTWSIRKITRYYKAGYISREEAYNLMRPLTASPKEVEDTLYAAEQEAAADTRAAGIQGARRGFMAGLFSDTEVKAMLSRFGTAPEISDKLIGRWSIERDSRYKQLSATQAQAAFKQGLISADELRKRLRNLGYTIRDADLIMARALAIEGGSDGLTPAELDTAIGTAIRNRKDAANATDAALEGRLSKVLSEATRIVKEVNKRLVAEGKEPIWPFPERP